MFRTFFLDSRFQNHPELLILQKNQPLSNQSFKHNLTHMPSLNLTLKFSFEKQTLIVPGLLVIQFVLRFLLQLPFIQICKCFWNLGNLLVLNETFVEQMTNYIQLTKNQLTRELSRLPGRLVLRVLFPIYTFSQNWLILI